MDILTIRKAPMLEDRFTKSFAVPTKPTPEVISQHTSRTIVIKQAKPLKPGQTTLFKLPSELRNAIYSLALGMHTEKVPLNRLYKGELNTHVQLLQTCSQVFDEARSLLANTATAYIPVMPGMDFMYGEPPEGYRIPPDVKATVIQALAEFTTVHFHLHTEQLLNCNSAQVLGSLEEALAIFMANSARVSFRLGNKKRHAIVHFDHFLTAWSKSNAYKIGTYDRLFSIMAEDVNTFWDIRFYAPNSYWTDLDLAQMRGCCRRYGGARLTDMTVQVEMDDNYTSGTGLSEDVTEENSHVTRFWPNYRSTYRNMG